MDTKTTLVLFPLFVMLMITLISFNTIGGTASEEFFGTREVSDEQQSGMENIVTNIYNNYGENPNPIKDGGDWSLNEQLTAYAIFWQGLDFGFNPGEEVEGHKYIANKFLEYVVDTYDENGIRIDNDDIAYLISIDPVSMEEWRELNSSNFDLDSTLVFVGLFFGVIILVGIIGIRIFGIGLADTSISTILTITSLLLVWTLLSVYGGSALSDLPVLGSILWIFLTFTYLGGAMLFVMGD